MRKAKRISSNVDWSSTKKSWTDSKRFTLWMLIFQQLTWIQIRHAHVCIQNTLKCVNTNLSWFMRKDHKLWICRSGRSNIHRHLPQKENIFSVDRDQRSLCDFSSIVWRFPIFFSVIQLDDFQVTENERSVQKSWFLINE